MTRAGTGTAGSKGRARINSGWFWLGAICVALSRNPTLPVYSRTAMRRAAFAWHLIASPFGTIEPAVLRYGVQRVGTAIPHPPARADQFRSARVRGDRLGDAGGPAAALPRVNRDRKGDRLVRAAPARLPQRVDADPPATTPAPADTPPGIDMPLRAPSAHGEIISSPFSVARPRLDDQRFAFLSKYIVLSPIGMI